MYELHHYGNKNEGRQRPSSDVIINKAPTHQEMDRAMKIFDIHAHIYPDAIADRAVRTISAAYDGITILNDGRVSTLVKLMDEAQADRFAVHSVATAPKQVSSINRFVLQTAQTQPGRIIPFAALHPDMEDPWTAVDELVAVGFKGVKLHPENQQFLVDEPKAVELFRAIAGKLPVLLHCGDYRCDNSAPERIKRMLKLVPGLTLICAHLGGWTTWEVSAAELIGQDIWVDTSSSLYMLDEPTARRIMRGYGTDRIVFGTDYPMWTPKDEIRRLLDMKLTDDEKENILWNNHLKLFGGNI